MTKPVAPLDTIKTPSELATKIKLRTPEAKAEAARMLAILIGTRDKNNGDDFEKAEKLVEKHTAAIAKRVDANNISGEALPREMAKYLISEEVRHISAQMAPHRRRMAGETIATEPTVDHERESAFAKFVIRNAMASAYGIEDKMKIEYEALHADAEKMFKKDSRVK